MKKQNDTPPLPFQHTIGHLLLQMGAISAEQLDFVVKEQQRLREDALLGKLLVANGFCTAQQLDLAIEAQQALRLPTHTDQALSIADIALNRRRRQSVVAQRNRILEKGEQAIKHISGTEYPAIKVNRS